METKPEPDTSLVQLVRPARADETTNRLGGTTYSNLTFNGGEVFKVVGEDFRVTNNTFKNMIDGLFVNGTAGRDSRGVVDHNKFSNISRYGFAMNGGCRKGQPSAGCAWDQNPSLILGMAGGVDLNGDGKYETAQAIYIEDNEFENDSWHHISSGYGTRYVARYNTITDNLTGGNQTGAQAVDAHGAYIPRRGSRSYEIYNNTLSLFGRGRAMSIRGGDGVIFGNTMVGDYSLDLYLQNERAVTGEGDCTNDGQNPQNYPCQDQIRELYIWDNTSNGAPLSENISVRHPNVLAQDRNYFVLDDDGSGNPNPDFALDLAANSWTRNNPSASDPDDPSYNYLVDSYTPFCYPHPLVSGVDCDPGNDTPTPTPTLTPTPLEGDIDQDGDVDIFDYNILIENFGSTDCGNVADINGDCKVDIFDYNALIENFGTFQ